MAESAASRMGQPFWTQEERNMFRNTFASMIKRGTLIRKKECDGRIDGFLKHMYPAFTTSLEDAKIRRSIYMCVNHMSKKRVTRKGKLRLGDLPMGVHSVRCTLTRKADGKNFILIETPCMVNDDYLSKNNTIHNKQKVTCLTNVSKEW
jgi:hypothetical protein